MLVATLWVAAFPWQTADAASSGDAPGEQGYNCTELTAKQAPDSAKAWLERSLWAGHCYIFRARGVRLSHEGVRTVALFHQVRDGIEYEVARFLDGPPVIYERRGRVSRGAWSQGGGLEPSASPDVIMSHLGEHYRLQLAGEERIAGRATQRLDIVPLDKLRFGHRLWLDQETALPLKQQLLGNDGQVLETFQMTDLEAPRLYSGDLVFEPVREAPEVPWKPAWLPPGYQAQPITSHLSVSESRIEHRLYSDGLNSFSLFVEPISSAVTVLAPGVYRSGVSQAAVRHASLGGRAMQILVLGEAPAEVLARVAMHVEWSSPDTHAASAQ
ncbi:MucB/RseB C-terminal domain-containing protein [Halomonas sp. WWR20]